LIVNPWLLAYIFLPTAARGTTQAPLRAIFPGPTAQPPLLRENEVIQWGPRSSAFSPKVGNTKSRPYFF
jgi:hypothetical protein